MLCMAAAGSWGRGQDPHDDGRYYRWHVTHSVTVHAQAPKSVLSPAGNVQASFRLPEFHGSTEYDLLVTKVDNTIQYKGSIVALDGSNLTLAKSPIEAEYSENHLMVADHSTVRNGKTATEVLVAATAGQPGTSPTPFQDRLLIPAGLLPLLCSGLDFRSLYGLKWLSTDNDPRDVRTADFGADGSLLTKDFAHRWSAAVKLSDRGEINDETIWEYDKPSFLIRAEGWRGVGGVRMPTRVDVDFVLSPKISEEHRVFTLSAVGHAKKQPLKIPTGSTVQDYRLLGPHLTPEQSNSTEPIFYDWYGSLPPLSALHPLPKADLGQRPDWTTYVKYAPPLVLIFLGVTFAMRRRLRTLKAR